MGICLDHFYLLSVVLHFEYKEDLQTFLGVNHKCEQMIHTMRVTPKLQNEKSVIWFFKHFSPETYDTPIYTEKVIPYLLQVDLIRSPNLKILFKKELLTIETFDLLIPKITSGVLDLYGEGTLKKVTQIIISKAKQFQRLERLEGDITSITEFLVNYTEGGKKLNYKMPKLVVVNCPLYFENENDTSMKECFTTITKCIPNFNRTKVVCQIESNTDEWKVAEEQFKEINFYYHYLNNLHKRSALLCEEGKVGIKGELQEDERLEMAYPHAIEQTCENNEEFLTQTGLPQSVEVFYMNGCQFEEPFLLKTDFLNVRQLFLNTINTVTFECSFLNVEILSIINCERLLFKEQCGLQKLRVLWIQSCEDVKFYGKTTTPLQYIGINISQEIIYQRQVEALRKIQIVDSGNVELSSITRSEDIEEGNFVFVNLNDIQMNGKIYDTFNTMRNNRSLHFVSKSLHSFVNGEVDIDKGGEWEYKTVYRTFNTNLETSASHSNPFDYFEVDMKLNQFISIGVADIYEHMKSHKSESNLPFKVFSFYSEDVEIDFCENEKKRTFGNEEKKSNVCGCGIINTSEIFFTQNGILLGRFPINFKPDIQAIVFNNKISTINCGESAFLYDLNSLE
ncbi:hypothetical protein EIN_398210 [Entamoeba invadens IP1]|uniref:SPRY domain-containing protein n=1 Tax=Entamoeba invadens IP1 TaxID=370355 RepID=A0A0A1UDK6_ENTIV|nr:hypothetical protein EIN_398210 [Entamoeba invadens IP1]ELP91891.1 hypothetical protein EIN_398210 [Entamoeba invadens IP1]|eukprot:XP_004258662.1 hypothetical protein EIN_398210 [Entamoeba invadens IP1]